jgi:hypothetical protein
MEEAFALIQRAEQHPSGRLFGMACPAQIDTCAPELLRDSRAEAKARGLSWQIHAAQSVVEFHEITRRHGFTPIQWLHEMGLLDERAVIGHGIFLDDHPSTPWHTKRDLDILADTGTTVAHCPTVFARRGIVPEAGSSWFLSKLVGLPQALEWCMTGRVFDAAEALAGRLVRSVHAPDDLLPAARALALEIAENTAPVSVAMTRQMLWRMAGAESPWDAHRVDSRAVYARGRAGDAKEGVVSFLEKRPPVYPDKVSSDMPDFFPWWEEERYY